MHGGELKETCGVVKRNQRVDSVISDVGPRSLRGGNHSPSGTTADRHRSLVVERPHVWSR